MSQSIEVYFFGLVCHIGRENELGRKNAAIIKTDSHIPKAVLGVPEDAPMEITLNSGDVLSLSIAEGDAVAGTDFETYVPSLLDKTDKPGGQQSLKAGVRTSKNFDAAVAYFQHTKSSLGVASLYPKRARYEMNFKATSEQCVAQVTLATASTNEDTIYLIRNNDGHEEKWPIQDGWLLIVNSVHPHLLGGSSQHFGQHRSLTDATEIATVVKSGKCDDAASVNNGKHREEVLKYIYSHTFRLPIVDVRPPAELDLLDATQVECSNTRWP